MRLARTCCIAGGGLARLSKPAARRVSPYCHNMPPSGDQQQRELAAHASPEQQQLPPPSPIKALLFDLDGTLYPTSNGYVDHVRQNLFTYMETALGILDAPRAWRPLFARYNQTLRGLRATGHDVNVAEYWERTRAGAHKYLEPAPEGLRELLSSLPQDKYIFTNCAEKQAEEILDLLGVRQYFKAVFGSDYMGDYCKPEREAYDKVLTTLGLEGREVTLFEDSYKNLVTARSLGMTTVFVNSDTAEEEGVTAAMLQGVDAVVRDEQLNKEAMLSALPLLWQC